MRQAPPLPTGPSPTKAKRTAAAHPYAAIMEAAAAYIADHHPKTTAPADIVNLMRPVFAELEQEEIHVLLLNTKNATVADIPATRGLLDRSQAHPREVFREAIRQSAHKIALVHNHPSGDPTPSADDITLTKRISEAGKIIGIDLIDHVIIGRRQRTTNGATTPEYVSLREIGHL